LPRSPYQERDLSALERYLREEDGRRESARILRHTAAQALRIAEVIEGSAVEPEATQPPAGRHWLRRCIAWARQAAMA
jgi:hypothetical protein